MLKRTQGLKRTPMQKGSSTLCRGTKLRVKKKSREQLQQQVEDIEKQWGLFKEHWLSKPHICESCDEPIWGENLSLYHDHLLEKGVDKYEYLKYEIDNLFLVCCECHTKKGNGFPTDKHKAAIEDAKQRYNL